MEVVPSPAINAGRLNGNLSAQPKTSPPIAPKIPPPNLMTTAPKYVIIPLVQYGRA